MHLDRLLDLLPVSSLSAILEEDIDYSTTAPIGAEPVPKALQQAVGHLANSGNEYSRRSFRMLKVLTVLAEGETIQSIKRFYPSEPFHLQNVTELMRLSLLESATSSISAENLAIQGNNSRVIYNETQKTLRVPRQVRDFVGTLISDIERTEIVHTSTDLLFGRKWREGKIRLRGDLPQFSSGGLTEPGNEHIVIRHLLNEALKKRNKSTIKRAADLGIAYAHKIRRADRFRDCMLVGSGTRSSVGRDRPPGRVRRGGGHLWRGIANGRQTERSRSGSSTRVGAR